MARQRIRDLMGPVKDAPRCRRAIESRGLVPHVLKDATGTYWDARSVVIANGQLASMDDPLCEQMIGMIIEGYFGDELKDAFVDLDHYWRIRDDLLTWPKHEIIAAKGLSVLKVRRRGQGIKVRSAPSSTWHTYRPPRP